MSVKLGGRPAILQLSRMTNRATEVRRILANAYAVCCMHRARVVLSLHPNPAYPVHPCLESASANTMRLQGGQNLFVVRVDRRLQAHQRTPFCQHTLCRVVLR